MENGKRCGAPNNQNDRVCGQDPGHEGMHFSGGMSWFDRSVPDYWLDRVQLVERQRSIYLNALRAIEQFWQDRGMSDHEVIDQIMFTVTNALESANGL